MEKNGKRILEFLAKDFERDEEENGSVSEKMRRNVTMYYDEIEGKFDDEEMKTLASCYETEITESLNSTSVIVSLDSLFVAFIALLVSISSLWSDYFGGCCLFMTLHFVLFILATFYFLKGLNTVNKTAKESVRLRNRMIALKIYQDGRKASKNTDEEKGREKSEEE